ncbi:aminotransferase class IV family protein [Streptomyces qinzhouensis]|uniref:Branched-chain amino acid aminotransferase n=1 Tax=Streptomyces qinzhouensis TaxID=2599401 RepID=A0A5B8J9X1_9ACTN|nr:aminotransferase class IV family protein [Streptomyces qinzhouensis]QDY77214.1 branched-chain amino acid aminotransferase [Streptomyces qinzhouensis]
MTTAPNSSPYLTHLNGRPATASELAPLAFAGHAHFTAIQVRDRRIRGLDLHLDRLRSASEELYGRALPDDRIRELLRAAVAGGPADLSLTVTVYSAEGEFTPSDPDADLHVLVSTAPPANGPRGPLSLATVPYERPLPGIKHVGEIAKTYYPRRVAPLGFDDAAFLDSRGRFSEASIWNLVFWDGTSVVWPVAEMLRGTMMGTVRRQLDHLGVPQTDREVTPADLTSLAGAAVLNSWTPAVPVHRIAATPLPAAVDFIALLHRAHQAEPPVAP